MLKEKLKTEAKRLAASRANNNVQPAHFEYNETMRRVYMDYAARRIPFKSSKPPPCLSKKQQQAIDQREQYYAGLRAKYSIYKK